MEKNLTKEQATENLLHYGVVGMKWGKRKAYDRSIKKAATHRESAKESSEIAKNLKFKSGVKQEQLDAKRSGMSSRKIAKKEAKISKLNSRADKWNKFAAQDRAKANKFIDDAAKLGLSYRTPGKDTAGRFVNEAANTLLFGKSTAKDINKHDAARQEAINSAAAAANKRRKQKGYQ